MRRFGRILSPLIGSGLLFVIYWFAQHHPLSVGSIDDVGETIFGEELRWLLFIAFIPLVFFVVRLLDALAFDVFMSRRAVAAPQLLRDILSIVLYFFMIAWAVAIILEKDVTGWLTAGTVVAAVLGLALQETLGNLFSGIALHLEDTFEVGDVIKSGDHIGVVEGFRWRGTRIRTFNNNLVVLPNSVVARERLEIFPRDNANARVLSISIDSNVPPATAIAVLTQAASHVEGVIRDFPCIARVAGFADSSVAYEIRYFVRDYSLRDRIDADIRRAVWYALRRHGVSNHVPMQRNAAPARREQQVSVGDIQRRLEAVEILSPLHRSAYDAIADAAAVHLYSKGETILRHDSPGDSMFIVHDGIVSVRLPDDSAAGFHEVAQLAAGSVFGEMALLTGETRSADVVAITGVTAFEIGKQALLPILKEHPELATAISGKVMERREHLDAPFEEEDSVLTRIRAYFGL